MRLIRLTLTAVLLVCLSAGAIASTPTSDSKGTDFWLAFIANYSQDSSSQLKLFITSSVNTSGTVTAPGLAFTQSFTVTADTVTTVDIPLSADMNNQSDSVSQLAIHVTALDEVTVYGLNRTIYTTDAFLGLPTDILGTDYLVVGYTGLGYDRNASLFGVVGTQDGTTVTITPSAETGVHPAGTAYTVSLNQGDTYQLQNLVNGADLSGTLVSSDKPVAVFGGHRCANVPVGYGYCDHLVEEMPPTVTWGKDFVTMPLATRLNGDTFRYLAFEDGTTINVNGTSVTTLNKGQYFEHILTEPAHITANNPILVAQYSNGTSYDGVTSDPFMMLIPPYEQFMADYTVTTPASGFATNYVNVVAPNGAVGAITMDGSAIPASNFTAIGSSGFSGAQVSVALGSHHFSGTLPFGVFVYGFDSYDSYGYPGGMSLAPVVKVTKVAISPETANETVGHELCFDATVTDQNLQAVEGVRVDFSASGVNSAAGFDNTDASGIANFCYTGSSAGQDSVTASVGTLSDAASVDWNLLQYTFLGFYQPIDNLPTKNAAKAGRTIPIKWALTNSNGEYLSGLDTFVSLLSNPTACDAAPTDIVEEQLITTGGTVLRYDATAQQFIYNWKTSSSWTGCRLLQLTLADDSKHYAIFKF